MDCDYYSSKEECDKAQRNNNRKNTNPRYRNFCQKYFTAGDEEQFLSFRDWTNGEDKVCPILEELDFDIWEGFSEAGGNSITDTFQYIFHKFKKGIYIRIKDNQMISFLPFSKAKFVNEWGDRIHIDPKYRDKNLFFQHINDMEKRPFLPHKVNHFPDEWYANNCLVRYEYPISEGDTGTSHIKNMFEELCKEKMVPNLEFFVNRRDFPLLKRNKTEPYDHIFDSDSFPLLSHNYEKYAPILSSVSHDEFADLAIPTIDDWARVKASEGAYFEKTQNRQFPENFLFPWKKKIPVAVFRGASTGCGTTIETNPRLKIAHLSSLQRKDQYGNLYLDAGITDWNLRPRKMKHCKYLQTIEIDTLPFSLVPKLTPEQQSEFKYLIHIQGHVSAFRLSLEMNMGSVILLVESQYHLWFFNKLEPYKHYVPVKGDLSDIYEKIDWCKQNDEQCQEIVKNCRQFYSTHLSKDAIFGFLQNLLWQTKKKVGNFKYPDVFPWKKILLEDCDWVLKNVPIFFATEENMVKVKETKNTMIFSCNEQIVKFTKEKDHELLREMFIFEKGKLKSLENFVQLYGLCEKNKKIGIAMQKIEGETYLSWLQNFEDTPTYKENFISILLQLSLSIFTAQVGCGFVHNDLMPWNIMIQTLDNAITPTYCILGKKYTLLPTRVKPIIIDYGKAHIVSDDNQHHGFINPFAMNDLHDLYFLICSSLGTIVGANKKKFFFSKATEDFFMLLINFFVPSVELKEKCISFAKLKHFLSNHACFSAMTNFVFQKAKIQKNLLDFIDYLITFSCVRVEANCLSFSPPKNIKLLQNLPCLQFTTKLLVYYFFQLVDSPKFVTLFETYLHETPDETIFIEPPDQLANEFFLKKNVKQNQEEIAKSIDHFVEEKLLVAKVLSYSGIFQVKENHKKLFSQVYEKRSVFDLFHYVANKTTLFHFSNQ